MGGELFNIAKYVHVETHATDETVKKIQKLEAYYQKSYIWSCSFKFLKENLLTQTVFFYDSKKTRDTDT